MTQIRPQLTMDDAALPERTRDTLRTMGTVDVVIGIPSHRNARTIGEVVDAVAEGVAAYFTDQHVLLLNSDGGSSDNTSRYVAEAEVTPNVTRLVTEYQGSMGKGSGIRAILEAATLLDARACVVLEARCPGITPEWLPALLNPVLAGADLAVASYRRSALAASLTDNLAYPFVRLFFNADLREPLAAEFCTTGAVAGELVAHDVWETDVARFGFNAWLAIEALAANRRIAQVDVGYRGDAHCEPGVLADLRFLHAVGTLFRFLAVHRTLWQQDVPERRIPFHGARTTDVPPDASDSYGPLLQGLREGERTVSDYWVQILRPETLRRVEEVLRQPDDEFTFPIDLWADIVVEFAVVYNRGDGDPDKVVEALLPLFCARAADYVRSSDGMTAAEREAAVEEIARAFVARRPLLRYLWDDYRPWLDPIGYWQSP